MSLEAIKDIAQAEENSRQMLQNARNAAKKAISDAEKAGAATVTGARERAAVELHELMKTAEEKAAAKAVELSQSTESKCAAIRAKTMTKMDDAAEFIVRRVVES